MNHRVSSVCPGSPRAFTLVEVTLALGIAVFCLVVVFGLMNVGMNTSAGSIEQTNASNIVCAVAADLRAAPTPATVGNSVTSALYNLQIPPNQTSGSTPAPPSNPTDSRTLDANGQITTATGRYQLDVWAMPSVSRDATRVRIMMSWPPKAQVPAGSVESVVSLDRN